MFEGLDIDWFAFTNANTILHFASGGGIVPSFVNEHVLKISETILSLPIISPEISVNNKIEDFVLLPDNASYQSYIQSFSEYARRGLFSYDKSVLNDYNSTLYHLVAEPIIILYKEDLPDPLRILMQTAKASIEQGQSQIDIKEMIE